MNEEGVNGTKLFFLVLIILSFIFLLCTIGIIAYKNNCGKDKVQPSKNAPTTPGSIGFMIEEHGKEKVGHVNF